MATTPLTVKPRFVAALIAHHNALNDGLHHDDGPRTIRDIYGLKYTGAVADLTLLALGRKDLSNPGNGFLTNPAPDIARVMDRARRTARMLLHWFNNEHTVPEHAAALRAMTVAQVCQMVAILANYSTRLGIDLDTAGPHTRAAFTEYLTTQALAKPEDAAPWPTVLDVEDTARTGRLPQLPITVDHAMGNDSMVSLTVTLDAVEELRWNYSQAIVMVSPHELPHLLWQPSAMHHHIENHPALRGFLPPDLASTHTFGIRIDEVTPGGVGQPVTPPGSTSDAVQSDADDPRNAVNLDGDWVTVYRSPDDPTVLRFVFNGGDAMIYELGNHETQLRPVPTVPAGWLELRPAHIRKPPPDSPAQEGTSRTP